MCVIYFIGSLIALALAMAFFLAGVRLQRHYEDEVWQRRIRGIRE
jgi:predicted Na+-dependent transporter